MRYRYRSANPAATLRSEPDGRSVASPREDDIVEEPAEPMTIEALIESGNARLSGGDLDPAIEDFGAAIRLDPTHTRALFGRAKAWHQKGEFARVIGDLDEVIR